MKCLHSIKPHVRNFFSLFFCFCLVIFFSSPLKAKEHTSPAKVNGKTHLSLGYDMEGIIDVDIKDANAALPLGEC